MFFFEDTVAEYKGLIAFTFCVILSRLYPDGFVSIIKLSTSNLELTIRIFIMTI